MRKRAIKLLSVLFITSSLLVALFPFYIVKADSATYKLISSNECVLYFTYNNSKYYYFAPNQNVRGVIFNDSTQYSFFAVSESNFGYSYGDRTTYYSSCPFTPSFSNNSSPYNNYYVTFIRINNVSTYSSDFPVIEAAGTYDNAIYYTFGGGSVDPAPPAPTYGDLILNGYSTDIAGQGEASLGNIDHIKWNNSSDTLGNDISNLKVRLQIVPGTYYGDSKAQLLSQTYEDMIIDINNAHEQVYDVSLGEVSFNWSDIVDWLNITSYKLWSAQLFGVNWEKEGWIYRIRLEDPENEFIGNWQTVYSSTSSGVENDFTIINSSTIDQTYITALQEVNNLNTVNNNWTVNNTEISVTNEYTEPQQGEKPWWAYLLESIFNTLNITNNYINEGNENTINITNTVDNSDDNMNLKINEYQQYEDDFIQDMDDNLTDIDTNVPLLSNNKFISSANWVAQQYNRMTNNTVIGSLLGFSLVFGLALIFIGRIR